VVQGGSVRKLGDVIGGLVLLCLGAWAIIGGVKLHLGKVSEPQPGFFPFWGGVVLVVLSGILLFQAWSGPGKAGKGAEAFGAIWRPMIMIIGMIAYVALLNTLGYLIATLFLSMVLLRVLGTKRVWVLAVAGLCIAFGSYILFDRCLNVTLPAGLLARFL
jgi:putative tricarboxylic transport membrane protein